MTDKHTVTFWAQLTAERGRWHGHIQNVRITKFRRTAPDPEDGLFVKVRLAVSDAMFEIPTVEIAADDSERVVHLRQAN